jgi:hypothetical protein
MRTREGKPPLRRLRAIGHDIQFAEAAQRHGLVREERETKAAKFRKWPFD